MSVWDKFNKLIKLDFDYQGVAPGIIPAIYANSKNQIDIAISVKVEGIDGPLDLKEEDLKGLLYFCDYTTGEKINSPWNISDAKNDYTKPVFSSNPLKNIDIDIDKKSISGFTYIHRYLSCSESNIQKVFSVGIAVPGIGDFDTSKNGTNTPNCRKGGSGSSFKSPKSLTISTRYPIDYSKPENITVKNMPTSINKFNVIVSNMKIIRGINRPAESVWYEGISSKATFTIHTRRELEGYVFKLGDPIRNNADLDSCSFPVKPDMIRGTSGANFDAQFVFVNQNTYGLSNNSKFFVNNYPGFLYTYEIGGNDSRHYWQENLNFGYITVHICNHRIPWDNVRKYEWNDQGRTIKVNVTDNYGNSGVIKIEAPNNDDSWPKLHVNGE